MKKLFTVIALSLMIGVGTSSAASAAGSVTNCPTQTCSNVTTCLTQNCVNKAADCAKQSCVKGTTVYSNLCNLGLSNANLNQMINKIMSNYTKSCTGTNCTNTATCTQASTCKTGICAQTGTCNTTTCTKTGTCQTGTCTKPSTTTPTVPSTTQPSTTTPSTTPTTGTNTTLSAYATEVVRLVNEARKAQGLSALTVNATLQQAAQVRAQETSKSFSHTRPDGTSWSTVLKQFGISYAGAGENIAMGQSTPQAVMTAWLNSTGHRANILNASFKNIGIGVYKDASGRLYWSQEFTY